jgi:hypothetical protein
MRRIILLVSASLLALNASAGPLVIAGDDPETRKVNTILAGMSASLSATDYCRKHPSEVDKQVRLFTLRRWVCAYSA